jgi:hypothetical protein
MPDEFNILNHFSEFAHLKRNGNNIIMLNGNNMPRSFLYKSKPTDKDYDYVFYTNGCSYVDTKYLDEAVTQLLPNALHINRAKGGAGNLEIVERTIRDLTFLSTLNLPVYVYVSFTEVCRNKEEFSLVDPRLATSITDYFKQILNKEYTYLRQALDQANVKHYITTSFTTNCFNNNRRIIDDCGVEFNEEVYGLFTSGLIDYMKDRNSVFKFNTSDFIHELDKLNKCLYKLEQSSLIDEYHPLRWECYQSVIDFAASYYTTETETQ